MTSIKDDHFLPSLHSGTVNVIQVPHVNLQSANTSYKDINIKFLGYYLKGQTK